MTALALRYFPTLPSLVALDVALLRLLGAGLVAIGISGGIAFMLGTALNKGFVSGDAPGVTYTPERCAELLEYFPGAPDCAAAATAHHFDEVVTYRLAAGALGILVLAAGRFLFRGDLRRRARPLPPGIVDAAGATAFGLAATGLLALGISQIGAAGLLGLGSANGAGAYLSGGLVAAPFTALYALRLLGVIGAGSSSRCHCEAASAAEATSVRPEG
jgi:hypothetical protein